MSSVFAQNLYTSHFIMPKPHTTELRYAGKNGLYATIRMTLYLVFYLLNFTPVLYLSNHQRKLTLFIASMINRKASLVICTTWGCGQLLTHVTTPIHLKVEDERLDISSTEQYQNVLWTLLCCHSMSDHTAKSTIGFFGLDPFSYKHTDLAVV